MKRLALAFCVWALGVAAHAASCSGYPYALSNGSLADANQVMSNFNAVLTCLTTNAASNGANSDITSLSGLTTPLSVSQGGTGGSSLVNTFNTRTGAVTLTSGDVIAALGFTPGPAPSSIVNTFNTRSGAVTLSSGDVTTALGFTPPSNAAATTSTSGLVALATGAQVLAGSNTANAVTPASLTSQQSLAASGYVTLPGGLILEWGKTGNLNGNANTAVSLPFTCPTAVYSVVFTPNNGGGSTGQSYMYSNNVTTSGFNIYNASGSNFPAYWQVICQ